MLTTTSDSGDFFKAGGFHRQRCTWPILTLANCIGAPVICVLGEANVFV